MSNPLLRSGYRLETKQLLFGGFCLVLLCIAYISHLGFLPLNYENDESRRALVSAEMIFSKNYITPTLNGEIYLNKPPLYNWIIILYFKLLGSFSTFALRLPVIVATIGMGLSIYYYTKKYLHHTIAFFTAFAFMTNGRILIFDSFIGLIDTSFAWLVYLNFILIYHYGEKKKYYQLFMITYLIVAAGFLMKGLPAIVFQGITLLTYFIWKKKFRILFHPSHFAGLAILLLVIGTYYWQYFSMNDIAPWVVFSKLMSESSKRTVTHYGIGKTIIHFFVFPFTFLYHFAPWTMFVIVFFHKQWWQQLIKNDFVSYSLLTAGTNLLVYWLSPEVYARYLFMFLPLMYSAWIYLFFTLFNRHSWQHKTIDIISVSACTLLLVTFLLLPFLQVKITTGHYVVKCVFLALVFGMLLFMLLREKTNRLYFLLLAVIFFRIGFNWFILEPRKENLAQSEKDAQLIAAITSGSKLYILRGAKVGNFDAKSFQIEIKRKEILRYADTIQAGNFYIIDSSQAAGKKIVPYLSFQNDVSYHGMLVKFETR
ncbi:MAG: hypothetical protein GC171_00575 [Terrimonas sp.]|nr:hypothetical protein [Terrimonas sp.]